MTITAYEHAYSEYPVVRLDPMNDVMLSGRFTLPTAQIALGGPAYVHFEYGNSSSRSVAFSVGHGRVDGFRFSSSSEALELLNPYRELGGLAPVIHLEPGEEGSVRILLNRYLRFLESERFPLRCEFDPTICDASLDPIAKARFRDVVVLSVVEDQDRLATAIMGLEGMLKSGDLPARLEAIEIASELRIVEALPLLASGIQADEPEIVDLALVGLGHLGTREARALLESFIESAAERDLRRQAQQQLESLHPLEPEGSG